MKHVITEYIPEFLMQVIKTFLVFKMEPYQFLPSEVLEKAESWIEDKDFANFLGVPTGTPGAMPEEPCAFWICIPNKHGSSFNPEYLRLRVHFIDALENQELDTTIDKCVVSLCNNRSIERDQVDSEKVFEFRCEELGIHPSKTELEYVLKDKITHNEARIIAKSHNLLGEYDYTYQKLENDPNRVISALAEWDLL